jgi:hypothetical protein
MTVADAEMACDALFKSCPSLFSLHDFKSFLTAQIFNTAQKEKRRRRWNPSFLQES